MCYWCTILSYQQVAVCSSVDDLIRRGSSLWFHQSFGFYLSDRAEKS